MDGTVIRLFINKGYGFLRGADGLSRHFHVNEFVDKMDFERLREGQALEFDPTDDGPREKNSNGLRAKNIRVKA